MTWMLHQITREIERNSIGTLQILEFVLPIEFKYYYVKLINNILRKVVSNMEETQPLARCFITRLSEQISIPKVIHTSLQEIGKNLVAVIPGESKKMIFFLTNASQIMVVRLFLNKDKLNEGFFVSLREALAELKLINLFSTGVCFKADVCVWEGVFEFENDANFEPIKARLERVNFVNKGKFEKISIEK
jgi:hypothetical protein